ncbi:MAG: nitroreductase [Lentisphaeraceae bacterium]|nr:nitroreductase [Lentisphaeraceae bacterium]
MKKAEAVLQTIRERRTIKPKEFLQETISDEVMAEILESANWAPNHGKTEPWRLTVFTGESGIKKYTDIIEKVFAETPDHLKKPEKLAKWTGNAPFASHIIAFGVKRTENCALPKVEEVCAVSCAAQNMMLVATAHGVASYWSSGIAHMPTSAAAFGLDGEEDQMLGFLHLGLVHKGLEVGTRKSDVETKVTWVK